MYALSLCYVLNDVISLERNPDEEAMLWEAYHVKDNSRLGCQIHITEDLDCFVPRNDSADCYC